jgi:hypothetical protein
MTYNAAGSPIYKLAQRLKNLALPILLDLDKLRTSAPSEVAPILSNVAHEHAEVAALENSGSEQPFAPRTPSLPASGVSFSDILQQHPLGDLEPSFELLSLFTSNAVAEESAILLNSDPLNSIFSYQFAVEKPKPPPQPKPKRRKERKSVTSNARLDALDASPGFRAPGSRTHLVVTLGDTHVPSAEDIPSATPSAGPSSEVGTAALTDEQKRRRHKTVLPGQNSSIVPDVSNQDSFKMFNTGWILPETERRGGRKAIDRHAAPPVVHRRIRNPGARAGSSIATTSPLVIGSDMAGQSSVRTVSSPRGPPSPLLQSPPAELFRGLELTSTSSSARAEKVLSDTSVAEGPSQPLYGQDEEQSSPADVILSSVVAAAGSSTGDGVDQFSDQEPSSSSALLQLPQDLPYSPLPALDIAPVVEGRSQVSFDNNSRPRSREPSPSAEVGRAGGLHPTRRLILHQIE